MDRNDNYNDLFIADPLIDEYVVEEDYVYGDYNGRDLRDKDIKEIVGRQISTVDGVLGLKGGLTDVFKADEDLTRGISVSVNRDGKVKVSAKVILADYANAADVIAQITQSVTDALQNEVGLRPEKVDIEVADTMSREAFYDKYSMERAIN